MNQCFVATPKLSSHPDRYSEAPSGRSKLARARGDCAPPYPSLVPRASRKGRAGAANPTQIWLPPLRAAARQRPCLRPQTRSAWKRKDQARNSYFGDPAIDRGSNPGLGREPDTLGVLPIVSMRRGARRSRCHPPRAFKLLCVPHILYLPCLLALPYLSCRSGL